MTTPLAVAQIVITQCWSVLDEQAAVNTFAWFVASVGGTPATDKDLADAVGNVYSANFLPIVSENVQFQGTYARILTSPIGPAGVVSTSGSGFGIDGTITISRQTSGIISWYTGFAGRAYRGRSYIPFPAAAQNGTDGFPLSSYVTQLGTFAGALIGLTSISAGGRTATVNFYLRHRKLTGGVPIKTFIGRPVWATQRRRGSYGRANKSPFG